MKTKMEGGKIREGGGREDISQVGRKKIKLAE